MAISKIIYKSSAEDTGTVWMDTTDKTVAADKMVSGITALKNDGTTVTGNLTSRSSSDLTASGATVTVPAGVYSSQASKAVSSGSASTPATTITANPSISVNSSTGVITATASATQSVTPTVNAGYVSSGTAGTITVSGSNTSQLSTQAAQTIHPSTTAQSIASGKFLTGAQTIAAVVLENLTAGNIKKDVVIKVGDADDDDCVASVTGTYEGGGGGSTTWETIYQSNVTIQDWGDDYNYVYIQGYLQTYEDFLIGDTYRITWEGVQYECVAYNSGSYARVGDLVNQPFLGGTDYNGDLLFETSDSPGTFLLKIEKQVSGGGSNWTLLASEEFSVNTSSTSSVQVGLIDISSYSSSLANNDLLWIHIRDKAGPRNGYFYGHDSYFPMINGKPSSANPPCYAYSYNNNAYEIRQNTYGLYGYTVNNNWQVVINSRYNASYLTINGTFKCDVYKLSGLTIA